MQRTSLIDLDISLFGFTKRVFVMRHLQTRSLVRETDDRLYVLCNQSMSHAHVTLERHLRKRFSDHVTRRTEHLARAMGLQYGRIAVRGQKSRWGSCSRAGNLNFNWRLIFTSPEMIDYVVIHELSHLVHHNHSRDFYDLVKKYCPDYKRLRQILQKTSLPF